MQGPWVDSVEREIDLTDWDAETASRMVEWLYKEDYHVPMPMLVPPETGVPVPAKAKEKEPPASLPLGPKGLGEAGTQPLRLDDASYGKRYEYDEELWGSRSTFLGTWAWDRDLTHYYGFSTGLEAHVKVYILAEYLLLWSLQAAAFFRIKTVLDLTKDLPGYHAQLGIVSLVRYIYANTASRENSEEPLRNLITIYVALLSDNFRGQEVNELMEEGGDFVVELCAKMMQQQAHLAARVAILKDKNAHDPWEEDGW